MARSRRDVLRLLLASGAAATYDVERLVWVPGQMVTVPAMPVDRMLMWGAWGPPMWVNADVVENWYQSVGISVYFDGE